MAITKDPLYNPPPAQKPSPDQAKQIADTRSHYAAEHAARKSERAAEIKRIEKHDAQKPGAK